MSTTLASGKVLDRHDISILSALNDNPRIPASELGCLVHLSRTAVSRRLLAMKEAGVFEEHPRIVSYESLGFTVHAFVEVYTRDKNAEYVKNALLERPEVLRVAIVAGKSLLLLEVIVRDLPRLRIFMEWVQRFGDTETKIVFSESRSGIGVKERIDQVEAL